MPDNRNLFSGKRKYLLRLLLLLFVSVIGEAFSMTGSDTRVDFLNKVLSTKNIKADL